MKLHNKELPKDCYKVSIDKSLVDAACIPAVANNGFKTVKESEGGFIAWPKDQVVFDQKVHIHVFYPPTYIYNSSYFIHCMTHAAFVSYSQHHQAPYK